MTEIAPAPDTAASLQTLEQVQRRVLWLATSIIHHANKVRENRSGVKVGGHQASSASMVSIMTALYFEHLRGVDRVSVKPHASPVLHAINYLLGRLDERHLTELRAFGGLQSYPSRTKDPDPVDFSTGSVGIGATATLWSALAHRYVAGHFEVPQAGREIALIGDAELDEGAIWEALVDPMVPSLGEVLWIVDLNRQSLDRVVPDIAAGRIGKMFGAAGWQTITVKYGRLLRSIFAREGGEALRRRIDQMPNEEYQRLLRSGAGELRERLSGSGRGRRELERLVDELDDATLAAAIRDLGGHDLAGLLDAFARAGAASDRPTVIFAYTIKAWGLPTEGHPANHSALLTETQWRGLAGSLGADADEPWARFAPGSPEAELCERVAARLERPEIERRSPPPVPADVGREHAGRASTQQGLGRFFSDLAHAAPEVAAHVVSVSPDVASSTNLGGWINRVGVWNVGDRIDWFADDTDTLVRWRESSHGQHIELGIAEGNLVGLLSELGATWSRDGQPLLPIGTMYDPFVNRALEQWSFGIYAGGQSILIGTPAGVTLAPEGGAHQSIITPSVGLEQPRCVAWEPAFGQDLEWVLLAALAGLGHEGGQSAYLRLSTRPIDQALAAVPPAGPEREARRRAALAGGYRLREAARGPDGAGSPGVGGAVAGGPGAAAPPVRPRVTLVGMGAVMPEVLAAADELAAAGIATAVVCLTSADLVFRALQARRGLDGGTAPDGHDVLAELFPAALASPLVTVLDGHPHTLAFLGAVRDSPISCLGVQDFGQSGDVEDLYRHFGIDTETIVGAALDLIST
ncbi:MAG TPA: 1-deoxy-D-xylulose-5-phosphate synthase N-terminal domain-containing protein [Solirubrobacteraceae bacterium]|nr:1-deoxy-D-xylulose-5-phosphate synthase N-terminal domain-containing protein [Solirubrobacteraceae bacterium]